MCLIAGREGGVSSVLWKTGKENVSGETKGVATNLFSRGIE